MCEHLLLKQQANGLHHQQMLYLRVQIDQDTESTHTTYLAGCHQLFYFNEQTNKMSVKLAPQSTAERVAHPACRQDSTSAGLHHQLQLSLEVKHIFLKYSPDSIS